EILSITLAELEYRFDIWSKTWDLAEAFTVRESEPYPNPGTDPHLETVVAGNGHTLGLTPNGQVYWWGSMDFGDGWDQTTAVTQPQLVEGVEDVAKVATGRSHSVALTTSGEVYTWGGNSDGQLGNGTTTASQQPQKVDLDGVIDIAAGMSHTLALRYDGQVYAWGN